MLGAILGVLFSFRGGTVYKATALISLGQPTSPGGALVNGFGTNPRAVSQIVSSAAGQAQAANRADMRPGALRGHVSVAQGQDGDRSRATRVDAADLARGHRREAVEHATAAANALADIVVAKTTAAYVGVKISHLPRRR